MSSSRRSLAVWTFKASENTLFLQQVFVHTDAAVQPAWVSSHYLELRRVFQPPLVGRFSYFSNVQAPDWGFISNFFSKIRAHSIWSIWMFIAWLGWACRRGSLFDGSEQWALKQCSTTNSGLSVCSLLHDILSLTSHGITYVNICSSFDGYQSRFVRLTLSGSVVIWE